MKEIIKAGLILFIITAVAGIALGFVYDVTKEPIQKQAEIEEQTALKKLIETADNFNGDEIAAPEGIEKIFVAYDSSNSAIGYVVRLVSTGYGGPISMLVGIDTSGSVTGIQILNHTETPGLGANATEEKFRNQFVGKTEFPLVVTKTGATAPNEIDAITSSTITTTAVTKGVNTAYEWYKTHEGGGN